MLSPDREYSCLLRPHTAKLCYNDSIANRLKKIFQFNDFGYAAEM